MRRWLIGEFCAMKVLDHSPHNWFLLRDWGRLLFDVHCERGAVGFSVLLHLNATETNEYRSRGREYLDSLARDIQSHASAAAASNAYYARDCSGALGKRVTAAVEAWRSSGAAPSC